MAQTKRRVSEPTHPSVWVGLVLAAAGLLVALYAYTGPRVYDITFFFVAIVGGVLAFAGILVSAWGRALGASRRARAAKAAKFGAPEPTAAGSSPVEARAAKARATGALASSAPVEQPPTVAAPAGKRGLLSRFGARGGEKEEKADAKPVFAFRRKGGAPEGGGAVAAMAVPAEPALERLTVRCPRCTTQFDAEGVRPFTATCPSCAFSAQV